MKTITIRFHHRLYDQQNYGHKPADGKEYDYLYDGPETVGSGDIVVVKVPTSGYTAVTVVRVSEGESEKAIKFIVDVVNVKGEAEREQRQRQKKAVQAELARLFKEQTELDRWAMLAATNPRAAELLEQMKKL